jgi:phage RecT family recombinase
MGEAMTTTTTKPVDESQALVKVLNEAMPELRRLAPKYVNLSRLMALALEAKMKNQLLAKCSVTSVIAFCKKCAEWGTDRVGAGGVWAVPFWNSTTGSYDMTPIPDWRLLVEKAKKAKAITHATADIVREGDKFTYSRGMTPNVTHEPVLAATGAVIAAYCIYTLPDGTRDFVVMSRAELDAIRNRSKAWQAYLKDKSKICPYNTDPEEMDKKTVIKRAMKLFEGASVELTIILEADHRAMGFADYTETPEPITMPKAIETTAKDEPGTPATTGTETPPPSDPPPAHAPIIPVSWTKGKDRKGKLIPHPHAGRSIADIPDHDLRSILGGLKEWKDARYETLLDAIEDELKRRIQETPTETEHAIQGTEQPQPTGTPLDQALAKITSIVTVAALVKFWAEYEKDITTWTGSEQSRFKMAFDSRMTEIKDLAKDGKLL